ncbi:8400_t:CDS:2, partial [Cetraspora pellucida]
YNNSYNKNNPQDKEQAENSIDTKSMTSECISDNKKMTLKDEVAESTINKHLLLQLYTKTKNKRNDQARLSHFYKNEEGSQKGHPLRFNTRQLKFKEIRCKTLVDAYNHKLEPGHIVHLNAWYQQLSNEMIEDLRFLTEYIYNVIYRLYEYYKDEKPDSVLFLESLFEKMVHGPDWKVYVLHLSSECRLAGVFWMSSDQQDLYRWFYDIVSELDIVNNAFIEDVNDEPQAILKSLLNEVKISNVIES